MISVSFTQISPLCRLGHYDNWHAWSAHKSVVRLTRCPKYSYFVNPSSMYRFAAVKLATNVLSDLN